MAWDLQELQKKQCALKELQEFAEQHPIVDGVMTYEQKEQYLKVIAKIFGGENAESEIKK